jgi:HK97 family phage prohead protease
MSGFPAKAGIQAQRPKTGPRPSPGNSVQGGVRFAGYAAVFGRCDRGGDVVRPGAFARSLRRSGGSVPLLWQHRRGRPVGRIEYLKEDGRGLRVIARLSGGESGRRAAQLLKAGKVAGLSFGYSVRKSSGKAPRTLVEVDLIEVSLVTVPMQPKARVHAVEDQRPSRFGRGIRRPDRAAGSRQRNRDREEAGFPLSRE